MGSLPLSFFATPFELRGDTLGLGVDSRNRWPFVRARR